MKKILIGALSTTLILGLAACSERKPDDEKPVNPPEENVNFADEYKEAFNASTILTSKVEGASELKVKYFVYSAKDHFTVDYYSSTDTIQNSFFYVKGENDELIKRSITINNEIKEETVLGVAYSSSKFHNLFTEFALTLKEDKTYDLKDKLDLVNSFNYQLTNGLTGELKATSASFKVANSTLTYTSSIVSDKDSLTLETSFIKKEDTKDKTLEKLNENDDTKAFKAVLDNLKKNNYTVTVKSENKELYKAYVTGDNLYYHKENEPLDYGFTKLENGYRSLEVNPKDKSVTLLATEEKAYSSLLASFDFSSDVLVKNGDTYSLSTLVNDTLKNTFALIGLPDYLTFKLDFKISDSSLTILSKVTDITYTIVFNNLGTTTLPVDLSNYKEKGSWKDVVTDDNKTVEDQIKALLGDNFTLPYIQGSKSWNVVSSVGDSSIDLYIESLDETEASSLIKGYADLLIKAGFKKLSEDDVNKIVAADDYYLMGGVSSSLYNLNNGFTIEVYDIVDTGYLDGNGLGLYISKLPDGVTL